MPSSPPSSSRTQTVVRISSPADIVGLMPHRMGFHPTESLVVLCLQGPRRRDKVAMRLDLPDPVDDTVMTEEVVDRLTRLRADAAILVCYTEAPGPAHGLIRAPLVRALRRSLVGKGIGVPHAILVREGRWWSYFCSAACCPPEGTPIPDQLTPSAALYAAESVMAGQVVRTDRAELAASVEPDEPETTRRWAEAASRVRARPGVDRRGRRIADGRGRPDPLAVVARLARQWSDGECTVSDEDVVHVAGGLIDVTDRDRVLTLLLDHEPEVLEALFTELARRTPDARAAPVCGALAWFAYGAGHGALAVVAAERALRVAPDYTLAQLVLEGTQAMAPPSTIRAVTEQVRADLWPGPRRLS